MLHSAYGNTSASSMLNGFKKFVLKIQFTVRSLSAMFRLIPKRISASPPLRQPQTLPSAVRFLSTTPRSHPRPQIAPLPKYRLISNPPIQVRFNSTSRFQKFRQDYKEAWGKIWQTNPIGFPLTLLFVAVNAGLLVYIIYDRVTRVDPYLNRFPPEVAAPLRKALHHSEIRPDPILALQLFREALVVAEHVQMHPFSDEVLGIRIAAAEMLEKNGLIKASIDMLEKTLADCKEWVTNGRRRQMIIDKQRVHNPPVVPVDPEAAEAAKKALEKEGMEAKLRDQVMKKVIGIKIKLADLYSSNSVQDMDKAENSLIGAVNESAGEVRRRRELNLPVSRDDGDDYVNLTEIAASCNDLADLYAKKGKHHLAATLYIQSLGLIKEEEGQSTTCAQVVLLNNISSQMAEEAQRATGKSASIPRSDGSPISKPELLDAAAQWAKKALDVAAHIKPPVRNEDCDQSCLAALYNLGEISEMQKKFAEARGYYEKGRQLASELQFEEGIKVSDDAIRRLNKLK
ncbi:TPR domain-containing protein [Blastomyces gilchristii SLH14081]|uniref:TPR domain-containing protein n=1 Tax=Blastomyces gilchristii (strain SLH14081) TaxID=559298 RepID=A0A179UFG9_BLAGS|nr:TPR domain-containing protein [Blastomyces gilchristii SLH14081]OAT05897.1 TPR domain-containing protein [Blastomyces gilchristii SLH14081]